MSPERIERVARAIWESECSEVRTRYDVRKDKQIPCSWDEYDWKDIYRRRATAAIEAIREALS